MPEVLPVVPTLPQQLWNLDSGRLALWTPQVSLTHGQLRERAERVAAFLHGRGLRPGQPVGICLERTPDLVAVILGAMRAGHPALVLDPRQPAALREARLRAAGAGLVVAWEEDGAVGLAVATPEQLNGAAPQPDLPWPAPETPAFLLYTSGSTGQPKGVEVLHGALAAYPEGFNAGVGIGPEARWLHVASFAYSASIRQLLVPLALGAAVVLAPTEAVLDPVALLELVRRAGVTVTDWVPSYLRQVCDVVETLPEDRRRALLQNTVAVHVSSGEPLPWSLVHRWRSLGFRGRIGNAYGLTETTGLVTWHEVEGGPATGLVPLGRALPQATVEVCDAAGVPSEEGTLWIGGPCLAKLQGQPRMLRYDTGDHARRDADGTLHFQGRQDDQIKLHGVRLTLADVEEALRAHPEVLDAAVLAQEDEVSHTRLLAWVVARPGLALEEAGLRRFLRERHAEAWVPAVITFGSALPRTLNGKLDRQALLAGLVPAAASAPLSTSDEAERVVRAAWEEALGPEAGEGDFFELGGDSMQVITMLARINAELQREVPLVAAFFGDPTYQGLLAAVRQSL